jgi:hypothetical protein
MSTINYTYNVIVDRFRQFAAGHFQLRRFTHGEISQADLEKEAEWPWLHVKPRAINYSPGTRSFQFEIFISDLPRDKEDKTGYQAESITDCSLIFQDLINEIYLGNMFGDQVVLSRPVNSEPFVEQYTHTLTGVTGTIELQLDYDWSACSIPASWNYNTPTDSGSDGWGALQFIESLDQNGAYVSLLNDEETPGNSYYYGTNSSGVKGWYAIVDNVGLTCETLPDCATIISIVDDIAALQSDKVDKIAGKGLSTEDYTTAEKSKLAGIQAGAEVNVNADWNATSGDAQILNKPTIPSIAGLVPDTRTITINGTTQDLSANRTFSVGTFNLPSLTSGSVLFSNGTTIAQDNANLFWDDTNNRLGIGTNAPTSKLTVIDETLAEIQAAACNNISTSAGSFLARKSRGSIASPSALLAGDRLGGLYLSGNNTGSGFHNPCALTGFAAENFTGSAAGGYLAFETTANGTISRTEKMRLLGNGNLLIGTTTDASFKLDVNGTARVQNILTILSNIRDNTYSTIIAQSLSSVLSNRILTIGNATYANINLPNGNVLIGTTTDAGYRLDVNGTVRTGLLTITGSTSSTGITFTNGNWALGSANGFAFNGNVGFDTYSNTTTPIRFFQTGVLRLAIAATTGNVLINTSTDVASSILTLASTTKGFLPPRMTNAQKLAIASPAAGLVVYDTTLNKLCVRGASAWETITSL